MVKGETFDESGGGGASDDARERFADEDVWVYETEDAAKRRRRWQLVARRPPGS